MGSVAEPWCKDCNKPLDKLLYIDPECKSCGKIVICEVCNNKPENVPYSYCSECGRPSDEVVNQNIIDRHTD